MTPRRIVGHAWPWRHALRRRIAHTPRKRAPCPCMHQQHLMCAPRTTTSTACNAFSSLQGSSAMSQRDNMVTASSVIKADPSVAQAYASSPLAHEVERTISNVLKSNHRRKETFNDTNFPRIPLSSLLSRLREPLGVARHLDRCLARMHLSRVCKRCFFSQQQCICRSIPTLELPPCIRRLFVLMHHKEVGLASDTAKLIFLIFAKQNPRLVVGGIGPAYQPAMSDMIHSLHNNHCLVLFPSSSAKTAQEWMLRLDGNSSCGPRFDLILIDGTWQQARKLYQRYINSYQRTNARVHDICLRHPEMLAAQARHHPVAWKQIGTLAALQGFLQDLTGKKWTSLQECQSLVSQSATATRGGAYSAGLGPGTC